MPEDNNACREYTYVKCNSCVENYFQDKNYYLFKDYVDVDSVYGLLNKPSNIANYLWVPQTECVAVTSINGCLKYSPTQNQCIKCLSGFFLSNGLCTAFPYQTITNCIEYSYKDTCKKCASGFFLLSQTECKAVTAITNCTEYDQTAFYSLCSLCDTNYFVSNNVCTDRTNKSITNCLTYNPSVDNCKTCSDNYTLSDDGLACLATIGNCKTYQASTGSSTFHTCSVCNDTYYIKAATGSGSNSCSLGAIDNCL